MSQKKTERFPAWGQTLAWLGAFASAVSLVNLIVAVFDVGVRPALTPVIEAYQDLLRPLRELVAILPLPFTVPDIAVDLASAYIILFGMSWRAGPYYYALTAAQDDEIETEQQKEINEVLIRARRLEMMRLKRSTFLLLPLLTLLPIRRQLRLANWLKNLFSPENYPDYKAYRKAIIPVVWSMGRKSAIPSVVQVLIVPTATAAFFVINAYWPFS